MLLALVELPVERQRLNIERPWLEPCAPHAVDVPSIRSEVQRMTGFPPCRGG